MFSNKIMCKTGLFFTLLLGAAFASAQSPGPKFKNDTVTTISGYKIYKGCTLKFAKGSGKKDKFRFVSIKNGIYETALMNNSVVVTGIKSFGINDEDDAYIEITGLIIFKDNTKGIVELKLFFDKAIENTDGLDAEIIVPAVFINNNKVFLYNELKRLLNLYISGTIDRQAYEAQKKKLLDGQ
jgi:hypothetical protein